MKISILLLILSTFSSQNLFADECVGKAKSTMNQCLERAKQWIETDENRYSREAMQCIAKTSLVFEDCCNAKPSDQRERCLNQEWNDE